MSLHLQLDEIKAQAGEIRSAFDELLRSPRIVVRRGSLQWNFFRASFERLMDSSATVPEIHKDKASQYRFEIEKKLKGYYADRGPALQFVFSIMDHGAALRNGFIGEDYPELNGYVILVSHARPESLPSVQERELSEHLVRVVDDAARAEFLAYTALPEINLSPLEAAFVVNGPAFRRVENVVRQHAAKRRTIREPSYNPSTMRMLGVRIGEVSATEATVFTHEYWYLRWWSLDEGRYTYVYNETNWQRYILALSDGRWLVDTNIYPRPRTTAVMRKPRGGGHNAI